MVLNVRSNCSSDEILVASYWFLLTELLIPISPFFKLEYVFFKLLKD
jgi:hypothetical protein